MIAVIGGASQHILDMIPVGTTREKQRLYARGFRFDGVKWWARTRSGKMKIVRPIIIDITLRELRASKPSSFHLLKKVKEKLGPEDYFEV